MINQTYENKMAGYNDIDIVVWEDPIKKEGIIAEWGIVKVFGVNLSEVRKPTIEERQRWQHRPQSNPINDK